MPVQGKMMACVNTKPPPCMCCCVQVDEFEPTKQRRMTALGVYLECTGKCSAAYCCGMHASHASHRARIQG